MASGTVERSPMYLLADVLVRQTSGLPLSEWMLAARTRVDRLSWARMAQELATLTQDQVTTTTVTLRSWFKADQERQASEQRTLDEGARAARADVGGVQ